MRRSIKDRVAAHLRKLGYDVESEDFRVVRGPKAKEDIIVCWSVVCTRFDDPAIFTKEKRQWELVSAFTLTALAKGLAIKPNTDATCMYGNIEVVPLK